MTFTIFFCTRVLALIAIQQHHNKHARKHLPTHTHIRTKPHNPRKHTNAQALLLSGHRALGAMHGAAESTPSKPSLQLIGDAPWCQWVDVPEHPMPQHLGPVRCMAAVNIQLFALRRTCTRLNGCVQCVLLSARTWGWPEPYMYVVFDCLIRDFPAKNVCNFYTVLGQPKMYSNLRVEDLHLLA